MKHSNITRRDFISAGIGVAGGLSLVGKNVDAQRRYLIRRECKGTVLRKNIQNLTAAELTAFKNGVAVMKSRSVNDPTSWIYQANIHGTTATALQTAWKTCQHNTTFFLSWHRMYICFFERILRKASGMPSLGLPYWNYSDTSLSTARFIPTVMRSPTTGNTLYDVTRSPALNTGTGQLSASAVSLASAVPGPTTFYTFSDQVQSTPHDVVHGSIGGNMGAFATAGQDPLFWLHHCNIDRLWNRWLSADAGRSVPAASDTAWRNTPFTFFDENGHQVQMTGADLINPDNPMCHSCYDEEAVFVVFEPPIPVRWFRFPIGYYRKPIVLGSRPVRFNIELNEKAAGAFTRELRASKAEDELTFKLDFEGAKADKPVEFFYEVYLNLPENVKEPNYRMDSYAGNLTFFGADQKNHMGHGEKMEMTFGVNLTDAVKRQRNLAQAKTLTVTLIPTGLVSRDEKRLPIRSNAKVSVDQITLNAQEPGK